jgi:transcriptional regulator with XRE-family HTH domain
MAILGRRLRTLRQRRDLTQGQLAVYAKVDRSYISQIENEHIDSVGSEILGRVAQLLRTTTDYLIGLTSNPLPRDDTTTPNTQLEYDLLDEFRKLDFEEQRYALAQLQMQVRYSGPHRPRIIGDDPPQEGEE